MAADLRNFWTRSNLWPVLSWLIAIGGSILQIYYISYHYFQYETVTQVTVNRSATINVPKLILCSDRTQLTKHDFWFYNESYYLNEAPHTDQLIDLVHVQEPIGFEHQDFDSKQLITVEKFTKQMWLCFSVAIKDELRFSSQQITMSQMAPLIYQISFNITSQILSDKFYWFVFTIPSNQKFYGESLNPILLPQFVTPNYLRNLNRSVAYKNFNHISVSFSYYYTQRLGYPLKTNCFDYSNWNFESQNHCYDDCTTKKMIEMSNLIPYGAIADNLTFVARHFQWTVDNSSIVKDCQSKCLRADCKTEEYVPWLNFNKFHEQPRLLMTSPRSPDVTTVFKPRFNPIDYITYIFSVISFWFGFSPLVILTKRQVVNWINAKLVKHDKTSLPGHRNCIRSECQRANGEMELRLKTEFEKQLSALRNEFLRRHGRHLKI